MNNVCMAYKVRQHDLIIKVWGRTYPILLFIDSETNQCPYDAMHSSLFGGYALKCCDCPHGLLSFGDPYWWCIQDLFLDQLPSQWILLLFPLILLQSMHAHLMKQAIKLNKSTSRTVMRIRLPLSKFPWQWWCHNNNQSWWNGPSLLQ